MGPSRREIRRTPAWDAAGVAEREEGARPPWETWRKSRQFGLGCWLMVVVGGGVLALLVTFVYLASEPLQP